MSRWCSLAPCSPRAWPRRRRAIRTGAGQPWSALLRAQRSERAVPAGPHPHLREQALLARWRHRGAARRAQVHRLAYPPTRLRDAEHQPSARAPAAQPGFRSRRRADALPAVIAAARERGVGDGRACPGHLLFVTQTHWGLIDETAPIVSRGPCFGFEFQTAARHWSGRSIPLSAAGANGWLRRARKTRHNSRSRGAISRPSFANRRPSIKRAQGMPGAGRTRRLVC